MQDNSEKDTTSGTEVSTNETSETSKPASRIKNASVKSTQDNADAQNGLSNSPQEKKKSKEKTEKPKLRVPKKDAPSTSSQDSDAAPPMSLRKRKAQSLKSVSKTAQLNGVKAVKKQKNESENKKIKTIDDRVPLFTDPNLPSGWTRTLVQRANGATQGKFDVYIISPEGKRLRSRNELKAFVKDKRIDVDPESFDFSVYGKEKQASRPSTAGESTKGKKRSRKR